MTEYYDSQETRPPELREKQLLAALPGLVARARENSSGWATHLKGCNPENITTRTALKDLPVLRKSEITSKQQSIPPLGGFSTTSINAMGRLFMSPGAIFEPEGRGKDWWRTARALFAAGFRTGDIVHNAFSYHLSPGGFILDTGARALGCPVIPAGVGNTENQVQVISHIRPQGYAGTPDFLKIILDKARETGQDVSSITKALVSGAALPSSLRDELKQRGINTQQAYITADLGLIAYETSAMEGLIIDEDILVEVVRPGTGDPVEEGEVGEVLVTSFNQDYPMIRFATGDLSAILPGVSPCGRTNTRIRGWMGRADQTAKVKGMFIHPAQIAEVTKLHPEISCARLIIMREQEQDRMTLEAESQTQDDALSTRISETLQTVTGIKGSVALYPRNSLPRDGMVIIDKRVYN